jgi:hypothetical protein
MKPLAELEAFYRNKVKTPVFTRLHQKQQKEYLPTHQQIND